MKYCEEKKDELANLFKLFGDATRVQLMMKLMEGELCVSELMEQLGMTQSAISHQLAILKSGKLIKVRKDGKNSYYSIADDHVASIMELGYEHICE